MAAGRIDAGREFFRAKAEAGSQYARLLMARARYYGYWKIIRNRTHAKKIFAEVAATGYAPAAAYCLLHVDIHNEVWLRCVFSSANLYALGVLDILHSSVTGQAESAESGRALIERAASEQDFELAMVDATWSPELQLRAAALGFGDAQFSSEQDERAAQQHYVPAMIVSPSVEVFMECIHIQHAATRESNDLMYFDQVEEEVAERSATLGGRYGIGKFASAWKMDGFPIQCAYYRERRAHHAHLTRTFMAIVKRRFAPFPRDMVRLLGVRFHAAQDAEELRK